MVITRSKRSDLWATLSGVWLGMSATAGPVWFVYSAWHLHYFDRVVLHHMAIGALIVLHFVADCVFVRTLGRPRLSALIGFATSLYVGKLLVGYAVSAAPRSFRMALAGEEWAYWVLGGVIAAMVQLVIQRLFAIRHTPTYVRR